MDDIRVLKHARHYIASMADGINPLTGEYAPPGDTISQERIQKCCAYVTDILNKLIESGGSFKPKKNTVFNNTTSVDIRPTFAAADRYK